MLMPARPRRSGAFDRIVILGFVIAGSALVLRTGLRPRDPLAGAAVVFAPWTSAGDALGRATAAGASIVRIGAIPSIVVVSPSDAGYVDRVLAEGALLVLDPQVLAACAPALLSREPSP
jgi:hypothetical protein